MEMNPEVATAWNILGEDYDYESDMDYELLPDEEYRRYQTLMDAALSLAEEATTFEDRMTAIYHVMALNSRYIYLIERQNWRPGQFPGTNLTIHCIQIKCLKYLTHPDISQEFKDLLIKLLAKITLIQHAAVPPGKWGCGWDLDFMA
ncbi:MAG: hypothetical protein EBS53_16295 [Bacteroidetes bacterium]|nr:hypothetical protein [Bacteroidota bacterium]